MGESFEAEFTEEAWDAFLAEHADEAAGWDRFRVGWDHALAWWRWQREARERAAVAAAHDLLALSAPADPPSPEELPRLEAGSDPPADHGTMRQRPDCPNAPNLPTLHLSVLTAEEVVALA